MNQIIIDLKEVKSHEELHSLLSVKLGFPAWYGHNWDAFWDLISDPEIVTMPNRLVIVGFKVFSEKLPRDARIFQKCFIDLKQNHPSISCDVIYS